MWIHHLIDSRINFVVCSRYIGGKRSSGRRWRLRDVVHRNWNKIYNLRSTPFSLALHGNRKGKRNIRHPPPPPNIGSGQTKWILILNGEPKQLSTLDLGGFLVAAKETKDPIKRWWLSRSYVKRSQRGWGSIELKWNSITHIFGAILQIFIIFIIVQNV